MWEWGHIYIYIDNNIYIYIYIYMYTTCIHGRVPILIACNSAGAHTRDMPRYIGYVSMPGVLRQTCLLSCFASPVCGFLQSCMRARQRSVSRWALQRSATDVCVRGQRQPGVLAHSHIYIYMWISYIKYILHTLHLFVGGGQRLCVPSSTDLCRHVSELVHDGPVSGRVGATLDLCRALSCRAFNL